MQIDSVQYVTIHGDEWKKEDIEDAIAWAKNQQWHKEVWSTDNEHWDHDHCQICWWKLRVSEEPEVAVGYKNQQSHWLCTECYEQFVGHSK